MNEFIREKLVVAIDATTNAELQFNSRSSHYEILENALSALAFLNNSLKTQEASEWVMRTFLGDVLEKVFSVALHFSNISYMYNELYKALHAMGDILNLYNSEEVVRNNQSELEENT